MTEENYTLLFPYMYDSVKMNERILQQSFDIWEEEKYVIKVKR